MWEVNYQKSHSWLVNFYAKLAQPLQEEIPIEINIFAVNLFERFNYMAFHQEICMRIFSRINNKHLFDQTWAGIWYGWHMGYRNYTINWIEVNWIELNVNYIILNYWMWHFTWINDSYDIIGIPIIGRVICFNCP